MHNIKETVRKAYGGIAAGKGGCCGSEATLAQVQGFHYKANTVARVSGYSDEELSSIPEDANLWLSYGNSVAIS